MLTVEVFKTNVQAADAAQMIVESLNKRCPDSEINFDLEDCDHILRVASDKINIQLIISVLSELGYCCELLADTA
ncbi:MAG TPA: hypothetical protein PL029_00540 [Bacteroidia bacterium]|nr:hypothetical protein [Bacteroidia bacterium]